MTRAWQRILGFLACALLAGCGSLVEFPPLVPESQANGGRTQAISVSPTDRNHIVIANEFGGLWKTQDGGRTWRHLDSLPAVFAFDVQFGADGRTLVATLGADGRRANRGGIWLSRDGGDSWTRPLRGAVPNAGIGPAGANAWGISVAPDETHRWYVGTDSGVARSADNGESWQHVGVDRGLPPEMAVDRRAAARSVLALPGGVVLAMLGNGIHRSSDHGLTWDKILDGDFTFIDKPGINKMDRSPDGRLAFILKDYWTLLVHDPSTGSFTTVRLASDAASNTKGPFVRISRPASGAGAPQTALTIWIGQGFATKFASVSSPDAIAMLRPGDWTAVGRAEGIHVKTGDLGLSGDFQPVMLGTEGGVFKPAAGTLLRWESGAAHGSQMNSFQITDLGGVNVEAPGARTSFLWFATHDNNLWASSDGGLTWSRSARLDRRAASRSASAAEAWMPVFTGERNPDGESERIGLVRLRDMGSPAVQTLGDTDLLTLPAGGSLGRVATSVDRAAVFGVHPTDASFVIAPDIVAGNVRVTRDGGTTWPVDDSLTSLVLQGGELAMYSAGPFYMQVTHIGFDPYRPDRIFVGTRDAGIACSADRGATWRLIPGSERITYVTGFHFLPSGVAHASSFGRGLWTLPGQNATCADAAFVQPPLLPNRPAAASRRPAANDGASARPLPRLWFSSSLPGAGAQHVGPDSLIVLRGERFTAHAGKCLPIVLDKQQRVGEAVPDANGNFLLRLHLPQIAKGNYRLRVLSDDRAVASVEFARVGFEGHVRQPEPAAPWRLLSGFFSIRLLPKSLTKINFHPGQFGFNDWVMPNNKTMSRNLMS